MKLLKILLFGFILILSLNNCDFFYQSSINVVGIWSWEAATDKDNNDLMRDHDYKTLEFKRDMTYTYQIDTFVYEGIYEVDEGANIIRFDYNKVWEILKSNSNQLWIRNLNNEKHEWRLKK